VDPQRLTRLVIDADDIDLAESDQQLTHARSVQLKQGLLRAAGVENHQPR